MTNARVPNQNATVYAAPDSTSAIVGELQPCDEFKLGVTKKHKGTAWISVTTPDGAAGYILGNTQVCPIRNVVLAKDSIAILDAPDAGASVKTICQEGSTVRHAGLIARNGSQWIEVRTPTGKVGFIAPKPSVTFEEGAPVRLANSCGTISFVGGLSLVLGLIGWLSESKVLPGWEGMVGGAVLLALGFLVKLRSRIALGLAVGIWCLELLSRTLVILAGYAKHAQPGFVQIVGIFIGYTFLKSMWRGFAAIVELEKPVTFLDWTETEGVMPTAEAPSEGSAVCDASSLQHALRAPTASIELRTFGESH